jgi:REP element-mobilizing transposase RayT
MTDKFQNKYRIPSARLQHWDYGNNGAYFITICTKNREHFFGEISDKKMQLNDIGKLAEQFWMDIPNHFPFVELGNFVIMPNHTHGILIINKKNDANIGDDKNIGDYLHTVQTLQCNVSADAADATEKNQTMANISPKPGTISTIIRSFKSATTKRARLIHTNFEWQTRFHDHIIRDTKAFENIQNYIANNPLNWKEDTFYANN